MQNRYYYLSSSLPYLTFAQKMPLSVHEFYAECKKWLSMKDLEIIHDIQLNNMHAKPNDQSVIKKWKKYNRELHTELAVIRTENRIKRGETHVKHERELAAEEISSHEMKETAEEIFKEKNPLLIEKKYEKIRWNYIEQHEVFYNFDINHLIFYLLKLQILERLSTFNKDAGIKDFKDIVNNLTAA